MGMFGKGVGVLAKGIGSGTPSFVLQDQPDNPILHPFRITTFGTSPTFFKVRAGTVNNIVPTLDGIRLDNPTAEFDVTGTATHRIYLKAEKGASPVFFPVTVSVITSTTDLTDTDDYGYLLIGSITTQDGYRKGLEQYVYASQVLVRAKPGDATALWLWSSR